MRRTDSRTACSTHDAFKKVFWRYTTSRLTFSSYLLRDLDDSWPGKHFARSDDPSLTPLKISTRLVTSSTSGTGHLNCSCNMCSCFSGSKTTLLSMERIFASQVDRGKFMTRASALRDLSLLSSNMPCAAASTDAKTMGRGLFGPLYESREIISSKRSLSSNGSWTCTKLSIFASWALRRKLPRSTASSNCPVASDAFKSRRACGVDDA
mmetsp:Transcript_8054/g.24252  ORF Transcript_8054/g.24252 Transcript_8054/m.24252 type:complete len:209 (+) Transcript_8054:881-1507(+)